MEEGVEIIAIPDIGQVFSLFQSVFVGLIGNAKTSAETERITNDFAQLAHRIAIALDATFPYSDEESIRKLTEELNKNIEAQRVLISLAKKRDSAKNN